MQNCSLRCGCRKRKSAKHEHKQTLFQTDQFSMVVTTEQTKLLGEIIHDRHVSCN